MGKEKHPKYGERILEIEHASFLPFVLSRTGSAVPFATATMKRLGAMLSEKFDSTYSSVMGLSRTKLSHPKSVLG